MTCGVTEKWREPKRIASEQKTYRFEDSQGSYESDKPFTPKDVRYCACSDYHSVLYAWWSDWPSFSYWMIPGTYNPDMETPW